MIELSKGLKAGAVSGVIYGAVSAITTGIITSLRWGNYNIPYYVFFSAIGGIIPGLIMGLIIGLIFAVVYNILPGTSNIVKGLIISIFFWFLLTFLFQYIIFHYYSYFSEYDQRTIITSLILFIFYGFLLGMFWDKFSQLEKKCQKCHRVTPKDARLCPYCGEPLEQKQIDKNSPEKHQNKT